MIGKRGSAIPEFVANKLNDGLFCYPLCPMLLNILCQLEAERDRLSRELNQLNHVLKTLGKSSGNGRRGMRRRRRKFSAETRRKIAKAQHARWAELKKGRRR